MKLNRQFIKFFWGIVICTVLALSYPSTEVWAEEEKTVLDITQGSVYIDENEITGKDPLGNDVTETDPDGYIIKGNGI